MPVFAYPGALPTYTTADLFGEEDQNTVRFNGRNMQAPVLPTLSLDQVAAEAAPPTSEGILKRAALNAYYSGGQFALGMGGMAGELANKLGFIEDPTAGRQYMEAAAQELEAQKQKNAPLSERTQRAIAEGKWTGGRGVEQTLFTVGEMAPGVASAFINPVGGLAYFAGQSAGSDFYDDVNRLKKRGFTEDEAYTTALGGAAGRGAVTAATEWLPLKKITEVLPKAAGENFMRRAMKELYQITSAGVAEAAQENIETLNSELWQSAAEKDPKAWDGWWQKHVDTTILAGLSGGLARVPASVVDMGPAAVEQYEKYYNNKAELDKIKDVTDQIGAISRRDGGFRKLQQLAKKEAPSRKDFERAGFDLRKLRSFNARQRAELAAQIRGGVNLLMPQSMQIQTPGAREEGIVSGGPEGETTTAIAGSGAPGAPLPEAEVMARLNASVAEALPERGGVIEASQEVPPLWRRELQKRGVAQPPTEAWPGAGPQESFVAGEPGPAAGGESWLAGTLPPEYRTERRPVTKKLGGKQPSARTQRRWRAEAKTLNDADLRDQIQQTQENMSQGVVDPTFLDTLLAEYSGRPTAAVERAGGEQQAAPTGPVPAETVSTPVEQLVGNLNDYAVANEWRTKVEAVQGLNEALNEIDRMFGSEPAATPIETIRAVSQVAETLQSSRSAEAAKAKKKAAKILSGWANQPTPAAVETPAETAPVAQEQAPPAPEVRQPEPPPQAQEQATQPPHQVVPPPVTPEVQTQPAGAQTQSALPTPEVQTQSALPAPEVQTQTAEVQTQPAEAQSQTDAVDQKVRQVYSELSQGERRRVTLADLRERMQDVPREEQDRALLRLERSGEVVLYGFDNPRERTPSAQAAALPNSAGQPRHVLYRGDNFNLGQQQQQQQQQQTTSPDLQVAEQNAQAGATTQPGAEPEIVTKLPEAAAQQTIETSPPAAEKPIVAAPKPAFQKKTPVGGRKPKIETAVETQQPAAQVKKTRGRKPKTVPVATAVETAPAVETAVETAPAAVAQPTGTNVKSMRDEDLLETLAAHTKMPESPAVDAYMQRLSNEVRQRKLTRRYGKKMGVAKPVKTKTGEPTPSREARVEAHRQRVQQGEKAAVGRRKKPQFAPEVAPEVAQQGEIDETAYKEAQARDEEIFQRLEKEFAAKPENKTPKKQGTKKGKLSEFLKSEEGTFKQENILAFIRDRARRGLRPGSGTQQTIETVKSGFRSRGRKPIGVAEIEEATKGRLNKMMAKADFLYRDIEHAARKVYGGVPWAKLPEKTSKKIFQIATGNGNITDLPAQLQRPVRRMRKHVDQMSKMALDVVRARMGVTPGQTKASEKAVLEQRWAGRDYQNQLRAEARKKGEKLTQDSYRDQAAPKDFNYKPTKTRQNSLKRLDRRWALVEKIESNFGKYMTRDYKAFTQADWKEYIERYHPELVENAVASILDSAPDLGDTEARALVGELLESARASTNPIQFAINMLHGPNTRVLKQRTLNNRAIQELLGVREDLSAYGKTVQRIAHLVTQHQMLTELKKAGMGKWLWEPSKTRKQGDKRVVVQHGNRPANATVPVTGSKDPYHPLRGLMTTPEIAKAFKEFEDVGQPGKWAQAYYSIEGFARAAVTKYSPKTHVRNPLSNVEISYGNGHALHTKQGRADFVQAFRVAQTVMKRGDVTHAFSGGEVDPGLRDLALEVIEERVVGENVQMGLIRDLPKAGKSKRLAQMERALRSVLGDPAIDGIKAASRKPGEFYELEDNVFKIFDYLQEKRLYQEAHSEWTAKQLRAKAAHRVRSLDPTYSMIPRIAKTLQNTPMGTFIAFRAERIRNLGNWVMAVQEDLADPKTRDIAVRRLIGKAAMAGLTKSVWLASILALGMSADDDKAVRELSAPWDENSDLLHLHPDAAGNRSYINLSYINPDGFFSESTMAFVRGKDWQDKWYQGLTTFFAPWTEEGLFASKLLDIKRNTKAGGGKVHNPAETWAQQRVDDFLHAASALQPGAIKQAMDVYHGTYGYESPGGKVYDWKTELLSILTGSRRTKLDPRQALKYKAQDYQELNKDSAYIYTGVAKRKNTSDATLAAKYMESELSRFRNFEDIYRSTQAAVELGISPDEIIAALRDGQVGEKTAEQILQAQYDPRTPDSLAELGRLLNNVKPEYRPALREALIERIASLATTATMKTRRADMAERRQAAQTELKHAELDRGDLAKALQQRWIRQDSEALSRKYGGRPVKLKTYRPTPSRISTLSRLQYLAGGK